MAPLVKIDDSTWIDLDAVVAVTCETHDGHEVTRIHCEGLPTAVRVVMPLSEVLDRLQEASNQLAEMAPTVSTPASPNRWSQGGPSTHGYGTVTNVSSLDGLSIDKSALDELRRGYSEQRRLRRSLGIDDV